jgi:hypothetical protein
MPPFLNALKRVESALRRKYGPAGRLPEVGRILAVDPGKITGVSVFWFNRKTGKVIAWAETLITHNEHIQVWDLLLVVDLLANEGRTDVVYEGFIVHSVKKEESFLSPVRIGEPFAWGVEDRKLRGEYLYPVEVYKVPPSEMSAMDDNRLKALGHFTPGPDHRRDATRHAMLHLKRVRQMLQNSRRKAVKSKAGGAGMDVSYWRWSGQENPLPFGKALANPAPTPRVNVQLNGVSTRKEKRYFDEN